jgi:hypothetical protein
MDTYHQLKTAFPELNFKSQANLAHQSYFKIGGPAEVLLEHDNDDTIADLYKWCSKNQVKITVLGGASNVVVSDQGISGLVLKIHKTSVEFLQSSNSTHQNNHKNSQVTNGKNQETTNLTHDTAKNLNTKTVRVGAGCKMSLLVNKTVDFVFFRSSGNRWRCHF